MNSNREIEREYLVFKAKYLVNKYGKEAGLAMCNDIILDKWASSTRTHWIKVKNEIEKL